LRKADPFYGVSSDIIVGFPGETEAEFAESVRVAREIGFTHAHIFPYSKRPGTVAATMDGQIPAPVKKERAAALAEAAEEASRAFFAPMEGARRTVLWERFEPDSGCLTGYTDNYVKVYRPLSEGQAAALENTFETVTIGKPFRNGVTCKEN
ncbi:MAG: tRNA (N(6)-L-threonylcarbamoyladenosine(37)-C(2))-methylthiotransferase MtaB, partial [Firmicutes bacterium]|nr:tRNA (N(6)-L-threonylcarbamoyladenosine(37)-C(2))-methylthiotransferase MtaB [Bacillota bacterium]